MSHPITLSEEPLKRLVLLFLLFCFSPEASLAGTAATLHSPWEAAPVTLTQKPYSCSPMVHAAAQISIMNNDPSYTESTGALRAVVTQVVMGAEAYQGTGSSAAVACALQQLQTSAQDGTMTAAKPDKAIVKREIETLRALAIAYLVLQPSGQISDGQKNQILGWMNGVLHNERKYYDQTKCWKNTCASESHMFLEIAVTSAALGIAEQDESLYHWAIGQYHSGVKRIDNNGTLHYDNVREYALKYNTDSAAALVQLAEFGEVNGEDLYAYDNGKIHTLVHTVTRGQIDPRPFVEATGRADQQRSMPIRPADIGWAVPYNARFNDELIARELRDAGVIPAEGWAEAPAESAPAADE